MPHGDRKLSYSGLYDAGLALSMKRKVVGNNLNTDDNDFIVITGANTGATHPSKIIFDNFARK